MPSDERVELALNAVAGQRSAFQAALRTTVEQMQHFLGDQHTSDNGRAGHLAAELGPFASSRIDFDRMAQLFTATLSLDRLTLETVEKARDTLSELAKRDSQLFLAQVEPDGDLRDTVARALEEIGRAFGAVRVFELTRSGSYRGTEHARSLGAFPFSRWSKGERRLAPPLVVTVEGADLRAERLAEFMDGTQKVILVVQGPCAPAPLVRLITPNTYVLQTHDGGGLDRFAAWEGPGIAAIVPESAARFTHDPAAGIDLWTRLTIAFAPEKDPRASVGGVSGYQQAEELRQLRLLAQKPAVPAGSVTPVAGAAPLADPVDKLAAWLLTQADLSNIG